jgi:hypothetical protein
MDNEANTPKKPKSKEELRELYKTNPYKNPKFIAKLALFALLGPIGWTPVDNGTTMLCRSELGLLILLIFLVTAFIKVALKKPNGWLFFAAFFYYSAFGWTGVTAWLYMIITGLALYVHRRWCME